MDQTATALKDRTSGIVAALRAAGLWLGAAGMALLSVWAWLLGCDDGQFVLKQEISGETLIAATLPKWLVLAAAGAAALGAIGILTSVRFDPRLRDTLSWCFTWIRAHPKLSLLIAAAAALGSIDIYEVFYDPYEMKRRVAPWMIRQDLKSWLQLGAAFCAALAISASVPRLDSLGRWAHLVRSGLRGRAGSRRVWIAAAGAPLLLGAAMSLLALEGIPHFSDALTYLMQGRMLWSGMLYMDTPSNPDLFRGSLFFVATDGRFFGKYPLGWPAILGTFDHFGIGFLANGVLVALAAVLTGLLARQFAPRRVAVLAAVLFGLSPWAWFNGANFASHVASTCAVTGFLWLFVRTLRTGQARCAIGAGLFLAAGVLIRPGDAAMFALPAIGVVLHRMVKQPRAWFVLGPLIAAAALLGVGVYLWQNAMTTGSPLLSPYALETRWGNDWNHSVLDVFGRFAFQWVELNQRFPGWGLGGITVGVLGAVVAGPRWRQPGLKLLAASSLLFFAANGAFGFTTVWWGPRWLLPVVPLLSVLAAELVDSVVRTASRPTRSAAPAGQAALCLLGGGLVMSLLVIYPGQFYENRVLPPHVVSAEAHRATTAMGLTNAVVAMPPRGTRAPLDARAGMAFMKVPFEANPVIFVRAIPSWPDQASKTFPRRKLYQIEESKIGVSIAEYSTLE